MDLSLQYIPNFLVHLFAYSICSWIPTRCRLVLDSKIQNYFLKFPTSEFSTIIVTTRDQSRVLREPAFGKLIRDMRRFLVINPNHLSKTCNTINTREHEKFISSICTRQYFPWPYQIHVHLLPGYGPDVPQC